MIYKITKEDFDTAFNFALNYHLDPKKSQSSRTSGASRGLGGVLDSFILGKLVELGVSNILKSFNKQKEYVLDFDIKQNNTATKEPDIINIVENGKKRDPNCFIEIKNISKDDRWIGLTREQFDTIRKISKLENIFIIGAYIQNNNKGNPKQKDLLGSYLKEEFKSELFKDFAGIENIEIVIEYAISGKELSENGIEFKSGGLMYETEIFKNAGKNDDKNIKAGKFKKIKSPSDNLIEKYAINGTYPEPKFIGDIKFEGEAEFYEKNNEKSTKRYIHCLTDIIASNDILGVFNLEKEGNYFLDLGTLGRKPTLDRNNIWIAKRNIPFLQHKKLIAETEKNLNYIAENI
jgi:hypothetical protein